ncbi:MAG: DUF3458 domain-containing protein, partial [Pyrinomonadaceae bacterium]|nr:DUF3458 domain-containing protein [Pyrinomonadaceae bacterium]
MSHDFIKRGKAFASGSLIALMLMSNAVQANPVLSFLQELPSQNQEQTRQVKDLPPVNYVRSHDYDVKHIALDLKFDWAKQQTYGTATLTVAPFVNPIDKVSLDAASMTINSVKLQNGTPLKFDYVKEKQQLNVNLDRAYKTGETAVFTVDYRTGGSVEGGILGGFGGGIRFINADGKNPNKPRQIWSQGETEYNRFWFPGYDSPNDFRTMELRATVEKPYRVVSNGKLLETKANADNTQTFYWKMDTPFANYLSSIVVGEYAEIKGDYDGIPISSYVYPNEVKEGEITTKRLPAMVKFFSERTGVRYPYAKYAQTMVEDFGGGMENITATTMIEELIHDARTEVDETSDSLQSHELAHQWFGNYVTCREWSEVWLNESFATYFQALWDEKSMGRDEFLFRDVRGNQQRYLDSWEGGTRRPVITKNYADKDAIFDRYAYERGGATLHMLRTYLGDDAFFKSLTNYLKTNANKPVSTEQLRIAFEETTGQSMDWFFDQWLYKMGHPIFEVTQNYDDATKKLTLNVKQTQKVDATNAYPQAEFFRVPLDIEIGTAKNTRVERINIEPKAENTFTFNVDSKPLLVNFDYQGAVVKQVTFVKSSDDLIYQLANDKDVLGRYSALLELGKTYNDDATNVADKTKIGAALNAAITKDAFWAVRRGAINQIADTQGQNAMRGLLSNNQQAAQEPKPTFAPETITALQTATKDQNSAVRAAAINGLSKLKDAAYAPIFTTALSDQSYNVVDSASDALAETKSPTAYERLAKLVDEPSWKNRVRIAGFNALATLGDKRSLDVALKYADEKQPSSVRTSALGIIAANGKGDARAYPLLFDAFKKSLDDNDIRAAFGGLVSIVKLGDSRGQQAIDLMKTKFAGNQQILGFVTQ